MEPEKIEVVEGVEIDGENPSSLPTQISSETIKELDESNEIENMKKIEAALFLSARFLSLQELVLLTDINPLMLKESMEKLIEKYNNDEGAIEIVVKENMWKMDVCKEYVSMVNKLATGTSEFTKSEQETLAVIAYKQPVKQSVVIKIRGNKAYDHVKKFIEVGLVVGKRVGHTKELKLSDDFFDYFHLTKKEDGSVVGIGRNEEGDKNEELSGGGHGELRREEEVEGRGTGGEDDVEEKESKGEGEGGTGGESVEKEEP